MFKKLIFFMVLLLAVSVLFTGCTRRAAPVSDAAEQEEEKEEPWTNPLFNMADVEEIGDVWQLDLTALAPFSWSDNDVYSTNPTYEVAEVAVNPNGGYDFTFTKFNQRVIFILDSSQRYNLWEARYIDVLIDGEATAHTNQFRYHIGWSELGSSWNASNSPDPGPFESVLDSTINLMGNPTEREERIVNFMIQTRGGEIRNAFEPVTVTIRSITFNVGRD